MKTFDSLIRVSKMNGRTESAESTMTIDDQTVANRQAVRDVGGRIGKTLKALDQSGFSVHESKAWATAVARIRAGQSDGVVVAYDDRLGRNWRKAGPFYDGLEAAGGELIVSAMPGVDYRTPQGRAMTGMLAVVSEMGYTAAKTRGDAIAERTVARGVPNRVAYGYRRNEVDGAKTDPDRDGKALVPDKHTAPTVKRIFKLRGGGESYTGIARALNAAGVPSPSGRQWVVPTITAILKNEVYLGTVVLGARRLPDAHKPLVTLPQFRRAQASGTVTRNGRMVAGLAGAVLICEACGRPMRVFGSGRGGHLLYGCRRLSADGPCPRPTNVMKAAADEFVDAEMVAAIEGGQLDLLASARELQAARTELQRATAERKAFVKLSSALEPEDFQSGYDERRQVEAQRAEAYEELLRHAAEVEDLPTSADAWHALDIAHQRLVAQSLIEAVSVAPPTTRSRFADISERFTVRWKGGS
jgi:DNA invertase Pin-like site-specific DNA recombinase